MLSKSLSGNLQKALFEHTACILFKSDGTILDASQLFLDTVGYPLNEIRGQHHRILCSTHATNSPEYDRFWRSLAAGESHQGTFCRLDAEGHEIWLGATYVPIKNRRGQVTRVFKVANDVTQKHQEAERQDAILQALDYSMAVIEFTPDGTILDTNENFEQTVGYHKEALIGSHHRKLCPDEFYRNHPDFWQQLANGEFMKGKFERLDAQGKTLWLEATYNPIKDKQGSVTKIVKFATDVTQAVNESESAHQAVLSTQSISSQTENIAQNGLKHLDSVLKGSEKAAQTLAEAQKLMYALNQQSEQINKMTGDISKIADQTNLLALNAAVEAARAGEQGRGFAVVANEVRQLSKGSSEAVAKITRVLQENSALVEKTSQAMQDVVNNSEKSQESIGEIESIVGEILTGAQNVSQSVEKLSSPARLT